jgi:hypothetical protein
MRWKHMSVCHKRLVVGELRGDMHMHIIVHHLYIRALPRDERRGKAAPSSEQKKSKQAKSKQRQNKEQPGLRPVLPTSHHYQNEFFLIRCAKT